VLKNMKTQTHRSPGQKGTKRLQEMYGDALLCVRYRHDKVRGLWLKTAEIIVEQRALSREGSFSDEDMVGVVVAYAEKALRRQLKEAGGMWNANTRLWQVSYQSIRGTVLEERITGKVA